MRRSQAYESNRLIWKPSLIKLKNNQHLAGLDAIRAIAILMVMTGHYYLEFLHPKELMAVAMMGLSTGGVIFFFLLSGYLISKSSEV